MLTTPEILRLRPLGFGRSSLARVWPFAAVALVFAALVLVVPRTFDDTAMQWLQTLGPVTGLLRELATASLLSLGGVVLLLRRIPPGGLVLAFTATLAQALIYVLLYLVALFVGLLLGWPLAVCLEAPSGDIAPALRGMGLGLVSAGGAYLAFAFICRLGAQHWPGMARGAPARLDRWLRLESLPDAAVRGLGGALVIAFAALFWTGLVL